MRKPFRFFDADKAVRESFGLWHPYLINVLRRDDDPPGPVQFERWAVLRRTEDEPAGLKLPLTVAAFDAADPSALTALLAALEHPWGLLKVLLILRHSEDVAAATGFSDADVGLGREFGCDGSDSHRCHLQIRKTPAVIPVRRRRARKPRLASRLL